MCEPNRNRAFEPHANLIDAARALLAQADGTMDPGRPWIELPTMYEVAALMERRFTALGTAGTPWFDRHLRAGAVEAARHLSEACRALENAWLAAYPARTRTLTQSPETSVKP